MRQEVAMLHRVLLVLAFFALVVPVTACGRRTHDAQTDASATDVTATPTASASDTATMPVASASDTAASPVASDGAATASPTPSPTGAARVDSFVLDTVPLSNAPLGAFPYFGSPPGVAPQSTPENQAFGHFLFWTGSAFRDVEGQTFMETIVADTRKNEHAQFDSYAVKRNFESLFAEAGGTKIFDDRIPSDATGTIPANVRAQISMGFGDSYNDPSETWVIRRPHDAIWVYFTSNTSQASLAVVRAKAFVPTSKLLPASTLRSELEKSGKAVIHVNFATDQTAILPASKPQIDEVVAMLRDDPALHVAINGYTDDTGSDEHNLTLSDGRANAVRTSLVSAGIVTDRLQAKGYGRVNPISSNADEAGKAANRRVELIKL